MRTQNMFSCRNKKNIDKSWLKKSALSGAMYYFVMFPTSLFLIHFFVFQLENYFQRMRNPGKRVSLVYC